MKLLEEVLEEIKPSKEEEAKVRKIIGKVIKAVNSNVKGGKAILGGSGAKGTNLKSFDIDIFVKFNYKKYAEKEELLPDVLEKALKKRFSRVTRLHGSRDYFQICIDSYTVEIVPILDVKNVRMAKNITDVSPFHAKWVQKYRKLCDDMRLAKQFCKAAGAYGAESYLQGFSGYVCEILTIHYGRFLGLIRAAAKWREKEVVDVCSYYRKGDIFKEMNSSKLQSPLIVVDPVQKDRNAAAALSKEKFNLFVNAARGFLKRPSKEFFAVKDLLEERAGNPIVAKITPLEGKADVVGAKLMKCVEEIARIIEGNDFTLAKKQWQWDRKKDAVALFYLKEDFLGRRKKIIGPPAERKEHVERFRKKYGKVFIENGKVCAYIDRKVANRNELKRAINGSDAIRNWCRKIVLK